MPIANRSTNVRAKPTGLGQPNRGGACEDGSNAAKPRADVGEQESLLAERRGLGNNLADRRVESTWLGKATGRDSVNATISMCTDFLVGTAFDFHLQNSRKPFRCHRMKVSGLTMVRASRHANRLESPHQGEP